MESAGGISADRDPGDCVDGKVGKDGSNTSRQQMKSHLKQIKSAMSARWSGIKYRFIQGNHDYSGFVKNGRNNFTQELLRFTYFNAGYIGKIDKELQPHISTASLLTVGEDAIRLEKYSAGGLYPDATRTIPLR